MSQLPKLLHSLAALILFSLGGKALPLANLYLSRISTNLHSNASVRRSLCDPKIHSHHWPQLLAPDISCLTALPVLKRSAPTPSSASPFSNNSKPKEIPMKIRFAAKLPIAANLCLLLVTGSLLSPPEALSAGCRFNFRFHYLGPNGSQESTYETAVADFDGDGHADLVVPLVLASTIQIYRGNGDGTFAAPVSYPAPGFVVSIAAGDFNGDGKPDLAAAAVYGVGVRIFLNDGSGGFGNPSTLFPAGSYPDQVRVADFNGDGNLDLTVPDFNAGSNQVLLGDGHGGFGAPISSPGGGGHIVAGDFNSDGKMDLAVATTDLKILLGNGAGGFSVENSYSFGAGNPTQLATADFNHDGTLDLAIAVVNAEPQVYTFLGNGMGAFLPSTPAGDTHAWGIVAVDLDGDGNVDIVTADYGYETVSFAKGNGRGRFAAIKSYRLPANPKTPLPINLTTGDFNEDGLPDLVTSDYGNGGATVALTGCR
jgi:hypothetical protein